MANPAPKKAVTAAKGGSKAVLTDAMS